MVLQFTIHKSVFAKYISVNFIGMKLGYLNEYLYGTLRGDGVDACITVNSTPLNLQSSFRLVGATSLQGINE